MIPLLLTVLTVFTILLVSEWGWRKGWLANEFGRKFVHITVGCFVAFWPYFLSWGQIRFLSAAFLLVVILTTYFNTFHAISSVQRPTYGEFFFAATVGILACLNISEAIYAVAILHMSLADGLAALVGVRYGRDNKYHVLGHNKSVIGTATFFLTSLVILIAYSLLTGAMLPVPLVLFIAATASMLENIAVLGLDNLAVPLFVCLLLVRF
ncbi:hypothetical protein EYC59_02945 [Candidatus Saccharibacteria bacterium]|nr:MAG: hypothetical protein EYC59_02945 [Candidatus Saccharibacteria bacterium]